MILGFAHLTASTAFPERKVAEFQSRGLSLAGRFNDVRSDPAKWPLMSRSATSHDLLLLKGSVAVEIVAHNTGTVAAESGIGLEVPDATVFARIKDLTAEREFFTEGFGFRANNGHDSLLLSGAFPAWGIRLQLTADNNAPPPAPLDVEGFSCIAFYSNNPMEDAARLIRLGGSTATSMFTVKPGPRSLEVLMLRSPNGIIVELIKIARQ